MNKLKTFFVSAIILIVLCHALPVAAQSGADISYSPITEYLTIGLGESARGNVRVSNPGSNYMDYEVLIRPFTSIPEEPGVPRPMSTQKAATYPYDASSWFSFSINSFRLDPLGAQEFEYNINVPADVEPGGYYAGIFFKDVSEKNLEEDSSSVGATLVGGPIFLIRVPGEITESIEVIEFKTDKNFYEYIPVDFITTIKNTGTVHVVPRGEIEVTNMFGSKVATMTFNQEKYNILRDHSSIFINNWNEGEGLFNKLANENGLLFGKMEAKLVVLYRSDNPGYDYKTLYTSFWVIPWKLLLIILAVIITIILIVRSKRRNSGIQKYRQK